MNADEIFARLKRGGQRLAGFGHPVHQRDPRTAVLLAIADELQLSGPHAQLARELEEQSERCAGKRLPLNVDGAIAALMCDVGIGPALGKAFFIIGGTLLVVGAVYLPLFWNNVGLLGQPARAIRSISQPDERDAASNLYRDIEKINVQAKSGEEEGDENSDEESNVSVDKEEGANM